MSSLEEIRRKMRHNPVYRKKIIDRMINSGIFVFIVVVSLIFLFGA